MRKGLFTLFLTGSILLIGLSGCQSSAKNKEIDNKITVYLWNSNLLLDYAPYVQSVVPEADIEFVSGNNDLDFYKFLKTFMDFLYAKL